MLTTKVNTSMLLRASLITLWNVQKIVNMAGLRMLILRKAGPWLASRDLDFGIVSTHQLIRILTANKLFMQIIWFILNTCFFSGSLKFWDMQDTGCLHGYPPIGSLDAEILMNFLSMQHFTHVTIYCQGT